jgi:hypothetical protein
MHRDGDGRNLNLGIPNTPCESQLFQGRMYGFGPDPKRFSP